MIGRVVEGYFPARLDRDHFVSIEPGHCYLVLAAGREGARDEERTEVPCSQADALMAVCAGKVGFECTILRLRGGKEALLQHFIAPGPLDLLSVEFDEGEDANAFVPLAWLGPEVTQNPAYDRGSLARVGLPAPEEIPLSNAMLDELLDMLEGRLGGVQFSPIPLPRATDARPADGHKVAGSEAGQLPAPSAESAQEDDVIAGLSEALEEFQATQTAPNPETATVTESTPAEVARPRFQIGRWR